MHNPICTTCGLPITDRQDIEYTLSDSGDVTAVFHSAEFHREIDATGPAYDQALVNYSVRNIQTADEEEIRLLELTDDESAGFPDAVRDEVRSLIAVGTDAVFGHARPYDEWSIAQEQILALLLPYISDRALYDSDYAAWEQNVLDDSYA